LKHIIPFKSDDPHHQSARLCLTHDCPSARIPG
jgi:hypothetical protein